MFRSVQNPVGVTQIRLTSSEIMLVAVASGLLFAAVVNVLSDPVVAGAMVLAAVAIGALVHERVMTRRMARTLAERLNAVATLDKLEVSGANDAASLDHALNRIIQQAREQAQRTAAEWPADEPVTTALPVSRSVAVLSVGLRQVDRDVYGPAHLAAVAKLAAAAREACGTLPIQLDVQADATVLIAFGAAEDQPVGVSLRQALDLAQTLSGDRDVRFGLSCGTARSCQMPDEIQRLMGVPFEEAARLFRMAASWHEYQLLCTEPVALLARARPSERTTLKLTHAALPSLPVYAMSLELQAVALSA